MNPDTDTGSQACAACRYQRRKCAPDCPLAPYFPSNHSSDFINAHKLFGVRNILKTLRKLRTFNEKKNAVTSMIYQANARARDPVSGCCGIISRLNAQIEMYQLELSLVNQQLESHQQLTSHHLQDFSQLNIDDDKQLQQLEDLSIVGNYQPPRNYNSFDGIYDATQLHPIGFDQQQQQQHEEPNIVHGNYLPPHNYNSFGGPSVRIETKESSSGHGGQPSSSGHGGQPSSSTK
ncbi:hypothetical protein P3X46_007417 [Hevea brasiliensis]|uniref:LOB domain-containing protein n=1 Tax=Hevea brasiliensis TaxID=3981 RepID=A0ABQ9MTF2_HEVBR|nr:LOB domain-containing protein 22-like [Hevea brasiliensis]KAJ9183584.1 hypothetical protein P3X46_007417 [Hevea brasiliensis]